MGSYSHSYPFPLLCFTRFIFLWCFFPRAPSALALANTEAIRALLPLTGVPSSATAF